MSNAFESTWQAQARWSATANELKRHLNWARTLVLLLTIAGAALVTLGGSVAGFDQTSGKVLGAAGAVALALAPLIGKNSAGRSNVEDWVRARSASEGLKTQLYFYLTKVGAYADPTKADAQIVLRREALLEKVNDLAPRAQRVKPTVKEFPPVIDVQTYIDHRLREQIEGFYDPRALEMATRLTWSRRVEYTLTLTAASLGAIAAGVSSRQPALWVPVVTTVAAAVTAHIASERYEIQIVSYSATARKLTSLREQWPNATDEAGNVLVGQGFVTECENVISSENQGWMAGWIKNSGSDRSH
jgi:hypothetical protein